MLVEAGIDEDTLKKVHVALHAERYAKQEAMKAALTANDFRAFTIAILDSPLADVVTTEADFQNFKEARDLMESGDKEAAKVIFDELGVPERQGGKGHHGMHKMHGEPPFFEQLTESQKAAFTVAKQANDRDAMDGILEEAGIVKPTKGEVPKFLKDGRELN